MPLCETNMAVVGVDGEEEGKKSDEGREMHEGDVQGEKNERRRGRRERTN